MELWAVLLLALLAQTFAADESCLGRCENGFDSQRSCQCDSMCKYYKSCCSDFEDVCDRMTRGDTFAFAEDDDYEELLDSTTMAPGPSAQSVTASSRHPEPTRQPSPDFSDRPQHRPEATLEMTKPPQPIDTVVQSMSVRQMTPTSDTVPPTQSVPVNAEPQTIEAADESTTVPVDTETTTTPDPDAEVCSGKSFDTFMQLKNGSIYAFRGKYFFELDQKSVLPGYPKLIEDVWGISGPIDAAFTRVNCQGKTYIFKGNKYWRFDNGVLDDSYPRNISVGFEGIPDNVDAALPFLLRVTMEKRECIFSKGSSITRTSLSTSRLTRSVSPCLKGLHPYCSGVTRMYTTTTMNMFSVSSSLTCLSIVSPIISLTMTGRASTPSGRCHGRKNLHRSAEVDTTSSQ
ncbi:hypothetical protein Q5P01_010168 [Channa striata]|uniref:SMB domain-containing protein n=1 Tax=Channa striata TaxID=64152 RepID=A0AA88MXG9_CHASR|nr:hypothetical protein Q5P01_010168 [Channa striata]